KDAAWLSVKIAVSSTALALMLGTSMAFAFARFRFRGREAVNFAVTLPIILPGVITGVSLASFFLFTGTDLSTQTVIVGHTTFCLAGADTTTLPLWILGAFRNSRSLPEVNAAATVILLISLPLIAIAAYLMREEGGTRIVEE